MPKIPGVNHLRAIKAFEKAGFKVVPQGKHIVMSDGTRFITVSARARISRAGFCASRKRTSDI
jgi:predicted RNA binding protein YcfA (HicA-like mRNA interferase family)